MPVQGAVVLKLNIRVYDVEVYVESRDNHNKPFTLAWRIKSGPNEIILESENETGFDIMAIEETLQDAVTTLSKWVRKYWPKVEAL